MKAVYAVIKPFKLAEVKAALCKEGFLKFTVTKVEGHNSFDRMGALGHLPKCGLTIIVPDGRVELAVKTILQAAHTGKSGDGCLVVTPVLEYWTIQTGEKTAPTVVVAG